MRYCFVLIKVVFLGNIVWLFSETNSMDTGGKTAKRKVSFL